jgi:hypothetical protein
VTTPQIARDVSPGVPRFHYQEQREMSINVKRVRANAQHRVKTTIVLPNDQGVAEQVEIDITFRGLTLAESSQFKDLSELEGEAHTAELIAQLAFVVIEIAQFVDDEDKPVACDAAFFADLDVVILQAISQAIAGAREVPTKPSNS